MLGLGRGFFLRVLRVLEKREAGDMVRRVEF